MKWIGDKLINQTKNINRTLTILNKFQIRNKKEKNNSFHSISAMNRELFHFRWPMFTGEIEKVKLYSNEVMFDLNLQSFLHHRKQHVGVFLLSSELNCHLFCLSLFGASFAIATTAATCDSNHHFIEYSLSLFQWRWMKLREVDRHRTN